MFILLRSEHLATIRRQFPNADENFVQRVHFAEFATWFKEYVCYSCTLGSFSYMTNI